MTPSCTGTPVAVEKDLITLAVVTQRKDVFEAFLSMPDHLHFKDEMMNGLKRMWGMDTK